MRREDKAYVSVSGISESRRESGRWGTSPCYIRTPLDGQSELPQHMAFPRLPSLPLPSLADPESRAWGRGLMASRVVSNAHGRDLFITAGFSITLLPTP